VLRARTIALDVLHSEDNAESAEVSPALRRPARLGRGSEARSRPGLALLGRVGFGLGACLTYGGAYRLGGAIGALAWALPGRNRFVTRLNLELCLPHLSESERARIARASLIETARTVAELGGLWTRPREKCLSLVREVTGREHLDRALAAGRGVLLLTPHLGSWEMGGLFMSSLAPTTSLYKPPHVSALEPYYRARRERFGARLVPASSSGLRALVKALRAGELVASLPDQDPGYGAGIFVPFFGVLANTSPLIPKLVHKTGAAVLLGSALRLPGARGFRLDLAPASAEIGDPDLARATAAMNADLERWILRAPEQYLWSYKRFKVRPPGEADLYKRRRTVSDCLTA
jgi:Kdo2-lipid IVA lauroyltransferase/acyltransferase